MQYQKRKEASRGHNFAYLTDDLYSQLERKGYELLQVYNGKPATSTHAESVATGIVQEFRRNGYKARVVCVANKLRIKEYAVFYKKH